MCARHGVSPDTVRQHLNAAQKRELHELSSRLGAWLAMTEIIKSQQKISVQLLGSLHNIKWSFLFHSSATLMSWTFPLSWNFRHRFVVQMIPTVIPCIICVIIIFSLYYTFSHLHIARLYLSVLKMYRFSCTRQFFGRHLVKNKYSLIQHSMTKV